MFLFRRADHVARAARQGLCGPVRPGVVMLAFMAGLSAGAQTTPAAANPAKLSAGEAPYVPSLTFDTVSIHQSSPADSFRVSAYDPANVGTVRLLNNDVRNLLTEGYGVDSAQLQGLPDWDFHVRFNIEAKSDPSVDEQLAKLTGKQARLEKMHMFQVMLADRFQLRVHWETREGPVWELLADKSLKLQPAGSVPPTPAEVKNFAGHRIPPLYQRGDGRRGYEFIGHACPMATLANYLTGQMGVPVTDHTGLTETYDFTLQYHGATPQDDNDKPDVWPALTMALPDQLGLRLKAGRGPRQYLVVDHIEKPSEN